MFMATIELDADVEKILQMHVQRSNTSLQETVNELLRLSWLYQTQGEAFKVPPGFENFRLREGINPYKVRQYVDDLEAEEIMSKQRGSAGE